MGYTTGWYRNAQGRRVYGKHSTSPGYYNKAGKWVVGKKKGHSYNGKGRANPRPDPREPRPKETKTANPKAHGIFKAASSRLKDGGPADPALANANDNASFKRQLNFNLDNNEDKAQGSQHEWAQPTSISNLISGQLRQASNAPLDAWEAWAANNGGRVEVSSGDSPFQASMSYSDGEQQQTSEASYLVNSQPMGAFGTSNVMYQYGNDPADQQQQKAAGVIIPPLILAENGKDWIPNPNYIAPVVDPTTAPVGGPTGPGTEGPTPTQSTLPNYDTNELSIGQTAASADQDVFGAASSAIYNPWGRMEGASNNSYGPSQQTMTNATMEAMEMAKAYFAPQRAELAYELGDMETDMRRLAVNLGRQVDDPVLQAKLYKEGMRSVRTLDIQQNTFAFQLADARRKEENQNFQFYDQLAQEEARMKIANRQYYSTLELQKRQYNLQNWAAQNPSGLTAASSEQQQTQGGILASRKLT